MKNHTIQNSINKTSPILTKMSFPPRQIIFDNKNLKDQITRLSLGQHVHVKKTPEKKERPKLNVDQFKSRNPNAQISKLGKMKKFNLEPTKYSNIDKVSEISSAHEKSLSSRRVATLNKNSANNRKTVFSSKR